MALLAFFTYKEGNTLTYIRARIQGSKRTGQNPCPASVQPCGSGQAASLLALSLSQGPCPSYLSGDCNARVWHCSWHVGSPTKGSSCCHDFSILILLDITHFTAGKTERGKRGETVFFSVPELAGNSFLSPSPGFFPCQILSPVGVLRPHTQEY